MSQVDCVTCVLVLWQYHEYNFFAFLEWTYKFEYIFCDHTVAISSSKDVIQLSLTLEKFSVKFSRGDNTEYVNGSIHSKIDAGLSKMKKLSSCISFSYETIFGNSNPKFFNLKFSSHSLEKKTCAKEMHQMIIC